jgi:hypothetical protein
LAMPLQLLEYTIMMFLKKKKKTINRVLVFNFQIYVLSSTFVMFCDVLSYFFRLMRTQIYFANAPITQADWILSTTKRTFLSCYHVGRYKVLRSLGISLWETLAPTLAGKPFFRSRESGN